MPILLFLIDTSASMNQRSHLGTTYLDTAKGAVETFMKRAAGPVGQLRVNFGSAAHFCFPPVPLHPRIFGHEVGECISPESYEVLRLVATESLKSSSCLVNGRLLTAVHVYLPLKDEKKKFSHFSFQAGWKENHATFMNELKNLQAEGLTTLGQSLRTAFDLLNLNRLVTGIDNYGQVG
nr:PREDICTED: integrator complex subunit 6-like [Bos mutus]